MQMTQYRSGARAHLALRGDLDDRGRVELLRRIGSLVDAGVRDVVIDLLRVSSLTPDGAASLVGARKQLDRAGGRLSCDALSVPARTTLELTGVDRLIPRHEGLQVDSVPAP